MKGIKTRVASVALIATMMLGSSQVFADEGKPFEVGQSYQLGDTVVVEDDCYIQLLYRGNYSDAVTYHVSECELYIDDLYVYLDYDGTFDIEFDTNDWDFRFYDWPDTFIPAGFIVTGGDGLTEATAYTIEMLPGLTLAGEPKTLEVGQTYQLLDTVVVEEGCYIQLDHYASYSDVEVYYVEADSYRVEDYEVEINSDGTYYFDYVTYSSSDRWSYNFDYWTDSRSPIGFVITGGDGLTEETAYTVELLYASDPTPDPSGSSSSTSLTPEQLKTLSVQTFVESLYINALGRTYDVTGRDYWTNKLLRGESATSVVLGFVGSPEFIGMNVDNATFVKMLYKVFFNRIPSSAEVANWVAAIEGGASRTQIVNEFAKSPEWINTCCYYQVNV